MIEPLFTLRPITRTDAEAIASWRYPDPYQLYNYEPKDRSEAVANLLDPAHHYYAVFGDAADLIAFRCFGPDARVAGGDYSEDALDMGGGLRPDLTGRGLGRSVISEAMAFGRETFRPTRFRTTVASFNLRALHVCRSLGYRPVSEFTRQSDQRRFTILTQDT